MQLAWGYSSYLSTWTNAFQTNLLRERNIIQQFLQISSLCCLLYLNKNRFFQISNQVLVITHGISIKYVLLLAVIICFPEVVPVTRAHPNTLFKLNKEKQARSAQQRLQQHSSICTALTILLRKCILGLCEGFLRRVHGGAHRVQVLWSRGDDLPQSLPSFGTHYHRHVVPSRRSCLPKNKSMISLNTKLTCHQRCRTCDSLVSDISVTTSPCCICCVAHDTHQAHWTWCAYGSAAVSRTSRWLNLDRAFIWKEEEWINFSD